MRRWPLILAVFVTLAALGYEWRTGLDANRALGLEHRVDSLRTLATTVDKQALIVRVSAVPSYDALVWNLDELRRRSQELGEFDPRLSASVTEFDEVVGIRNDLVEKLKALRSATRNANTYLVRYVTQPDADAEVIRKILAHQLVPSLENANALSELEVGEPIKTHIKITRRARVELDDIVLKIADRDLATAVGKLETRIEEMRERRAEQDRDVRVVFLTALALLLLFEVWSAGRSRRATIA
jgi:hypothetical protein